MNADAEPRSRLLRGAGLTLIGLTLTGFERAAVRIGAERLIGVDALGVVTIALSVATLATIVGAGGLSAGVTKFIAQLRGEGHGDLAKDMATFSARLGIAFSLAGVAVGVVYATFSTGFQAGLDVVAVGALVFAFGLYLSGKSILYGEDRIRRYVMRETVGAVGFLLIGALVVVVRQPAILIIALVVAYLPVGLAALRAFRPLGPTVRLPIRPLIGYGVLGVVGSLAGIGFSYSTPIVAASIDALAGAALIGAALTILEPFNLLPRAVSLVLLPDLSEKNAREGSRRAGESLRTATGLVAALAGPVLLVVILEQTRILGLVFKSVVGGPTLAWFALAFGIRVIGTPAVTALAAIDVKHASISMWSSLTGFVVAGAIWVLASPSLGVEAVGIGYAAGSLLQVAAPLLVATRYYTPRWGSLWYRVAALATLGLAGIWLAPAPRLLLDAATVAVAGVIMLPELGALVRAVRRKQGAGS